MTDAVLHLTIGTTPAEHIGLAMKSLGRTNDEVLFTIDATSAGPLGDIDRGAASRIAFWSKLSHRRLRAADTRRLTDMTVWKRIAERDLPVVVWNSAFPLDRLQTLRACWHLRKQPHRLFEVKIPPVLGRAVPPWYGAVGLTGPDRLAEAWATRCKIRNVATRAKRWVELRSRRGEWIRHLEGERIVELPMTAYDAEIIAHAGSEWKSSQLVMAYVIAANPTGTELVGWRIRQLIEAGRLERRGRTTSLGVPDEIRVRK